MAFLNEFMQNPATILGLSVLNQSDRPAAGLLQGQLLNQRLQGQRSAMETAALNRQLTQQQILKAQQEQELASRRQSEAERQRAQLTRLTEPTFTGAGVHQGMATGGQVTGPSELQAGLEAAGLDPAATQAVNRLASIDPQAANSLLNALKPAAPAFALNLNQPAKVTDLMAIRDKEGNPPPLGSTNQEIAFATDEDGSPKYTVTTPKERERKQNVDTALGLVATMKGLAFPEEGDQLFQKFEGIFGRAAQGATNFLEEQAQSSERGTRLRLYNNARQGFLSMMARTFGERGTLTNQDISRAQKLLADAGIWPDQPETARRAFDQLEKLVNEIDSRESGSAPSIKAVGDQLFQKMPDGTWETLD